MSRPTLTSLVDGLERGGLLRRAPVPNDRRGIQLIATEAGRAALRRAEAALAQRMLELIDRDMAKVVGQALSMLGAALDRDSNAEASRTRRPTRESADALREAQAKRAARRSRADVRKAGPSEVHSH